MCCLGEACPRAAQVLHDGGFWYVEEHLAHTESGIRDALSDWMELYDAHGEKFYYNNATGMSTFEDPRVEASRQTGLSSVTQLIL